MAVAMALAEKTASSTSMQGQQQHHCLAIVQVLATAVAIKHAATAQALGCFLLLNMTINCHQKHMKNCSNALSKAVVAQVACQNKLLPVSSKSYGKSQWAWEKQNQSNNQPVATDTHKQDGIMAQWQQWCSSCGLWSKWWWQKSNFRIIAAINQQQQLQNAMVLATAQKSENRSNHSRKIWKKLMKQQLTKICGSNRATCFAASNGGRESFSPLITINWLQRLPDMPCYGPQWS